MIYHILFILFFFFTHKQSYSVKHFTGGSEKAKYFITSMSMMNLILEISYLVYSAIAISFLSTIILLIVSYITVFVLNYFISRFVIKQTQKELNVNDPLFMSYYNRKCDIFATITAIVGVIVNIIITIVFIVNIFCA